MQFYTIFRKKLMLCLSLIIFNTVASFSFASVLIWPVQLHLESNQKSVALWIENQGKTEKVLQGRAFAWKQVDGKEVLDKQNAVIVSKIAPGKKQLIRVMSKTPAPSGKLVTYRVVLDEIPKKVSLQSEEGNEVISQGIQFQFRYSLPLLMYGKGLSSSAYAKLSIPEIAKNITWQVTTIDGKNWLSITNKNQYQVHLNHMRFSSEDVQNSSLTGYILPNATMKWEISQLPKSGDSLRALINGRDTANIAQ